MPNTSRKTFIKTTAMAAAGVWTSGFLGAPPQKLLLSFSTLGCPDWTLPQIAGFARQHGYSGIEVRGIQRQLNLPQSPGFNTAESRRQTMTLFRQHGLQFVGLGASAHLHLPEGPERENSLAGARQFIDLAAQIRCPYVRVFPNNFPPTQTKEETLRLIVSGLKALGDYAKRKNVAVLMETHGDVVQSDDILAIMQAVAHPAVGLVWDIANMWTITRESPAVVYRKLKNFIRHTHIKDAKLMDGKPVYTLLGDGEVPVLEAVNLLKNGGYKGYYSFEWEKLWHPEIAEPEVALAHYPVVMKKHF